MMNNWMIEEMKSKTDFPMPQVNSPKVENQNIDPSFEKQYQPDNVNHLPNYRDNSSILTKYSKLYSLESSIQANRLSSVKPKIFEDKDVTSIEKILELASPNKKVQKSL